MKITNSFQLIGKDTLNKVYLPLFGPYDTTKPIELPSGRSIYVDNDIDCVCIKFSYLSDHDVIQIPFAKYRPSNTFTFGTFGLNVEEQENINVPFFYLTDDGNELPVTADIPIMDDDSLQNKLSSFLDENTGRDNCDVWMKYTDYTDSKGIVGVPAVEACREFSTKGIATAGYFDCPNVYELAIIYCESEYIDLLDPYADMFPNRKLSNANPSGLRLGGNCFTSTEADANNVAIFGYKFGVGTSDLSGKNYAYKIIPCRCIYGDVRRYFYFSESLGDFESTGDTTHDRFESTQDGDPVVLTYDNFTINEGHTVTTTNRCKGLYLYIKGDLTINGILSMTARGANAIGRYVGIDYDLPLGEKCVTFSKSSQMIDLYESNQLIYPVGGLGAIGANGSNGVNGACGAGGGCSAKYRGGNGTSFSGGSGAGGFASGNASIVYNYQGSTQGSDIGGAGGSGVYTAHNSSTASHISYGGGGAGNPGGWYQGNSGTGGLLILIVDGNISINGSIQSNGTNGGNGIDAKGSHASFYGGSGSGGGAIHIFCKGYISGKINILAIGGEGGNGDGASLKGYSGGNGYINIVSSTALHKNRTLFAEQLNNRSLDEEQIGIFIDKPLYRKNIQVNTPIDISSSNEIISLEDLDIENIVDITGTFKSKSDNGCQLNYNYSDPLVVYYDPVSKTLACNSSADVNKNDIPLSLSIKYTKSNDTSIEDFTPYEEDMTQELYYTNELVIGSYINGKPLYRKVVECKTPATSNLSSLMSLAELDIDEMVNISGTVTSPTSIININYYINETNRFLVFYNYNDKYLNCNSGTTTGLINVPLKIILEYTKTTDEAGEIMIPANNYVEGEQPIGTWVDGKTIYRYTFIGKTGSTINTSHDLKDVSNLNIDSVINLYGTAKLTSGAILNLVYGDANASINLASRISNISTIRENHNGTSYNNIGIIVIIEYTKKETE